jgi:hypothetical protein
MMNKEKFRAKAQFFRPLNNPGLKAGVIDNETFVDFSPKSFLLVNTSITIISRYFPGLFMKVDIQNI